MELIKNDFFWGKNLFCIFIIECFYLDIVFNGLIFNINNGKGDDLVVKVICGI